MLNRNSVIAKLKNNSPFSLFLIGQAISCLGDSFHFIAIALLLIKMTGSGTSAAFIVICTPISSFFLSPFAGGLGDKFNEKYLLGFIDLLKALTTIAFIFSSKVSTVYILMLLLASLEILHNPSKQKIITRLLNSNDILMGNSILTGIIGFTFIIGPIVAGILIGLLGIHIIFFINCGLYLLSAIIFLSLRIKSYKFNYAKKPTELFKDISSGIKYFKSRASIRKVILISTLINLLIASLNISFYSFAFDILKVNGKIWGIMMSVFYGANLVSMFVSIYLDKIIKKMDFSFVYIVLIIISGVWLCYGFINDLLFVFTLQFIEGLLLSLIAIILSTKLQIITNKEYISRIIGINDIYNNIGKLIAIGITYFILQFYTARFIFILNGISLVCCTLFMIAGNCKRNQTTH